MEYKTYKKFKAVSSFWFFKTVFYFSNFLEILQILGMGGISPCFQMATGLGAPSVGVLTRVRV
jgi:hypothetical protein